jgi:hypothetical protein
VLSASQLLGDGYVDIPSDVLSIGERIAKGDPTMGWRGDPRMSLCFNPQAIGGRPFEVWGVTSEEKPYIVATYASVSATILADLAASDWQHGPSLLAKLEQQRAAERKAREDRQADREGEVIDKMLWAVNKSFHTETGGRPFVGQVGAVKEAR